jgi:hypothetical protein
MGATTSGPARCDDATYAWTEPAYIGSTVVADLTPAQPVERVEVRHSLPTRSGAALRALLQSLLL